MSKTKVEELRAGFEARSLSVPQRAQLDALLEAVREEERAKCAACVGGVKIVAGTPLCAKHRHFLAPLGIDPQSAREWARIHALLQRLNIEMWPDDEVHGAFEDIAEKHPFRSLQPYADLVAAAVKVSENTAYIDATNMVVSNTNQVIAVLRFALERLDAKR